MSRFLVVYASKHGSTEEVAQAIAATIRAAGHEVDIAAPETATEIAGYTDVVVGGSLYMGRWHPDARRFLHDHRRELDQSHLAVFALGPLSLEEKEVAGSRRQLDRALERLDIRPRRVAIFGGVVRPSELGFPFNRMPETDARDWTAIERWATEIAGVGMRRPTLVI